MANEDLRGVKTEGKRNGRRETVYTDGGGDVITISLKGKVLIFNTIRLLITRDLHRNGKEIYVAPITDKQSTLMSFSPPREPKVVQN